MEDEVHRQEQSLFGFLVVGELHREEPFAEFLCIDVDDGLEVL